MEPNILLFIYGRTLLIQALRPQQRNTLCQQRKQLVCWERSLLKTRADLYQGIMQSHCCKAGHRMAQLISEPHPPLLFYIQLATSPSVTMEAGQVQEGCIILQA